MKICWFVVLLKWQLIFQELREKLINHINDIGKTEGKERDHKLKELLNKSFPVVKVKALRPIVMAILKNTPQIDDHYLKVLVRDRELYNDTDTEVKRQIWKDNQSLFGDEVSPLLSQYISEKENVLFDHSNLSTQFFGPSPKVSISHSTNAMNCWKQKNSVHCEINLNWSNSWLKNVNCRFVGKVKWFKNWPTWLGTVLSSMIWSYSF